MAKQLNKHTPNSDELLKRLESNDSAGLDDFEKEALEGFESLENNELARALNSELDSKINEVYFEKKSGNRTLYYLSMAAGIVLVIGLSVLFYNILNNQKGELSLKEVETAKNEALPDQLNTPGAPPATSETQQPEQEKNSEIKQEVKTINEQQLAKESKPLSGSTSRFDAQGGAGISSGPTKGDAITSPITPEKDYSKPTDIASGAVSAAPMVAEEKNQIAANGKMEEGENFASKASADKDIEDTKARSTVVGGMKKSAAKSEPKRKEKSAAPAEALASDDRESSAPSLMSTKSNVAADEMSLSAPSFKYKSYNRAQDYIKTEIDKNEKLKSNVKEFIAKLTINESGKVSKVKFLSSFSNCNECESLIETILLNMPNWNPAQQGGKSVKETIHFVYP